VRKRRIEAAALADLQGRYGFSGGWHLSAFISWAIGIAAYQAINQWLPNLGATLPALAIGALCYFVMVSTRKTEYA
jgi:NCS1 family nucleobase:cation symporter-1